MQVVCDITPVETGDPGIGLLLAVLDDTTNEWRKYLGDVPDEALNWRPFPGGHTIGGLILHIADVEAHWLHEVAAGVVRDPEELATLLTEETQQGAVQWPDVPEKPLSWFFAQHGIIRRRTVQIVLGLESLTAIGRRDDEEFTLRWLLNHVISHEAYHGGQAVLLNLMRERM